MRTFLQSTIASICIVFATACISNPATYHEQRELCLGRLPGPESPDMDAYSQRQQQREACQTLLNAGHDDAELHYAVGRLLYLTGLTEEMQEAIKHLRIADKAGNAKATTLLGNLVNNDPNVTKAIGGKDSRTFYEEAAARGDPYAQVLLTSIIQQNAVLKENRLLSPEERQHVLHLLQQAAAQGYILAEYHLGRFYWNVASDTDMAIAMHHLERAARGGVRQAAKELQQWAERRCEAKREVQTASTANCKAAGKKPEAETQCKAARKFQKEAEAECAQIPDFGNLDAMPYQSVIPDVIFRP
ncbi:MAG: sel1 repeat family protein [Gammaproteobacteria bacterium]|nr:sel1 repeat family protein [Gammaproteobacteria bacterium]